MDVPQNASPDLRLRRAEQLESLRGAVADLPERQRTALILRTLQQMSYADIADIMKVSIPAVRAHVHFARTRLAERLGANASEGQP
jgi:RNA polymerase sigma-70 factor (ECF subfamily)